MRIPLLFIGYTMIAFAGSGQNLSVHDLFSISALSPAKFDKYLVNNGFISAGREFQNDTAIYAYHSKKVTSEPGKLATLVNRSILRYDIKNECMLTLETNTLNDYLALSEEVKNAGFRTYSKEDSATDVLFQKEDMTVHTFTKDTDTSRLYAFELKRKTLPLLKDIYYADDLLQFTSHEYLVHAFGAKNVKKDIYFFSENELAKCSVLFLNTDRQAVFIWNDKENNCGLSNVLLGGQQMLQSTMEDDNFVRQNNWRSKNGLRAGMTLYELLMLNGQDFKFHSGDTENSGYVMPDTTGKINFEKFGVILGCMNCRDSKYQATQTMTAGEAISDERIFFVLSVILNPANK